MPRAGFFPLEAEKWFVSPFLTLIGDLLRSLIDGNSRGSFVSPRVPDEATGVVFDGFLDFGDGESQEVGSRHMRWRSSPIVPLPPMFKVPFSTTILNQGHFSGICDRNSGVEVCPNYSLLVCNFRRRGFSFESQVTA